MTDDEFLLAFRTCSLSRSDWTHEAHVRMAWLFLSRFPFVEALDRIRCGIRKLNTKIGQPAVAFRAPTRPSYRKTNGDPNGYHETITIAFARIIAGRLKTGESFSDFRERNPDLLDRKLPALTRYYSPALLRSSQARRAFIEPDLRTLPG